MGNAIPTLGYPTRTAAVLALRKSGQSLQAVADKIGIKPKVVAALEISGKRSRPQRISESMSRTIVIPNDVLDALTPAATKRGLSVNCLVRTLVSVIADEKLVTAILDDMPAVKA